MSSLSHIQFITLDDGAGTNCVDRALAVMSAFPQRQMRAVIGTMLLQNCRDLRTGHITPWAKPWGHHIWLIEQDGGYFDPSACNLAHWGREIEMALPRPLNQLTVGVIDDTKAQRRLVEQTIGGHPTSPDLPDVLYLPGLVYSSDVEERPAPHSYVTAWGRLAHENVKAGGWNLVQLEAGLERLETLMTGPPLIRSIVVPQRQSKCPRRSRNGFAQLLQQQEVS